MKTDSELRKLFAVYPDERDIIEVIIFGNDAQPEERVRALAMACREALVLATSRSPKKEKMIVDLASLGSGAPPRALWAAAVSLSKEKQISKVAVVGGGSLLQVVTRGQRDKDADKVKWFGDRAGAIHWLR
ncbi:MAG: STAS/SEC14 domain-containing protein [Candidatus Falkowbacteria bacterium]